MISAWDGREDFSKHMGSSGTDAGSGWTVSSTFGVLIRELSWFKTVGTVVDEEPATFQIELRFERYVVSLLAFNAGVAGISSDSCNVRRIEYRVN